MLRYCANKSVALRMLVACCVAWVMFIGMPTAWADGEPLLAYRRGEDASTRKPLQEATPAKEQSERRLIPFSESKSTKLPSLAKDEVAQREPSRSISKVSFPKMEALQTAGTGLGIVLGLFFISAWLFKRGGPRPTSPLPKEVASVLGRSQLAGRQFVQLMRVGNKLVLVALTPDGVTPITEVIDPMEVDRLLGLCMRNHSQSTSAEFQQVLDQLSRENTKGFIG